MAKENKVHELKMDSDVFTARWNRLRPWEVRENDRDFKAGDKLVCRETVHTGKEMADGAELEYTGREIFSHVKYVEHGPVFGIKEGWVVMTVEEVRRSPE